MDLTAIGNTEVFFHCLSSTDNLFHFVKGTFSIQGMIMEENFHMIMPIQLSSFGAMTRVDEGLSTVWHAIATPDRIGYLQHSLSDFSVIGSKYITMNVVSNGNIYAMDIKYYVLYI